MFSGGTGDLMNDENCRLQHEMHKLDIGTQHFKYNLKRIPNALDVLEGERGQRKPSHLEGRPTGQETIRKGEQPVMPEERLLKIATLIDRALDELQEERSSYEPEGIRNLAKDDHAADDSCYARVEGVQQLT
jgi:hypothetical protein